MKKKLVVTSLYGDPLHVGHIECLQMAKELGDLLFVLVDSDEKAVEKKGYVFMPLQERVAIVSALGCVDRAIPLYTSVAEALAILQPEIFAKGGDRTIDNLPQEEIDVCQIYNIQIITGLGDKIQSSSFLVNRSKKFNE